MRAIQVVGYANSGKTTLVERLITEIRGRGYRVAAVKHAPHGYDVDTPNRDTWKYYHAGAEVTMVVGHDVITIHRRYPKPPTLAEALSSIEGVDLVIVEGFKHEPGRKIEVLRQGYGEGRLNLGNQLLAVVSDQPLTENVPVFSRDDISPLADLILTTLNLTGQVQPSSL